MTSEERRKRPEHHVVHDYANLVSTGRLRAHWRYNDLDLATLGPVTGHLWHAFYLNARKMYEFFTHSPHKKYLRALQFTKSPVGFEFPNWTREVQNHMNTHMLHVARVRISNKVVWKGDKDLLYLADFERAWQMMMENLKDEHKHNFRDEIDHRLSCNDFQNCGTLGKEFIL